MVKETLILKKLNYKGEIFNPVSPVTLVIEYDGVRYKTLSSRFNIFADGKTVEELIENFTEQYFDKLKVK